MVHTVISSFICESYALVFGKTRFSKASRALVAHLPSNAELLSKHKWKDTK